VTLPMSMSCFLEAIRLLGKTCMVGEGHCGHLPNRLAMKNDGAQAKQMIEITRIKYLRIALVVVGLTFVFGMAALHHLALRLVVGSFALLEMILAIYATLGVFLLLAARNPRVHRSLIWFTEDRRILSARGHGHTRTELDSTHHSLPPPVLADASEKMVVPGRLKPYNGIVMIVDSVP